MEPAAFEIRFVLPADATSVAAVTRDAFSRAFGQAPEVRLLEELRRAEHGMFELLADRGGSVVGHVAMTRARVPDGSPAVACLGPMCVAPAHQRQGIGIALVEAALCEAWSRGHAAVVLVGHPGFYGRVGFERADRHGVTTDIDCPPEAFLIAFRPGGGPIGARRVRFAEPFYDL